MKKLNNFLKSKLEPIIIIIDILLIVLLSSCSSSDLKVSEYEFKYLNQDYTIRSSYCAGNPESCNQLIGSDFIAVDMNQDRIIDKITTGNVQLAEAQEVYDYCLTILEKENKLNEIDKSNHKFSIDEDDYQYEIKTFYPKTGAPFNEFIINDKRSGKGYYTVSIFIDNKADGTLDEILKGGVLIKEAQTHYKMVLEKGLKLNKLVRLDSLITVR